VRDAGGAGNEPGAGFIEEYFKYPSYSTGRLKKLYAAYTGKKFTSYSRAFKENPAAAVFFILWAAGVQGHNMPGREGMNDAGALKKNRFMKTTGLTGEEYRALYREAARQLAGEAAGGAT
jgi:hypothetical protein